MTRPDYTPEQRGYKAPVQKRQAWDTPHFFRVKYTRGGAPCGLKVWFGPPADPVTGELLDRSPRWQVHFNGKEFDEPERFLLHFEPDGTPVIVGEIITESEYSYLTALHEYAINHDATMPEADVTKPVNLRKMAPVLPPK